jgi:hypothetical protein
MAKWFVDVQSMIPMGQIGERMVIAQIDEMAGTVSVMGPPTMTTYKTNEDVPEAPVFMQSFNSGRFGTGEIDNFLLAVMECGWRRGLRPKAYDPSAGELVAMKAHLEDMRKVALARADRPPMLMPNAPSPPSIDTPQDDKKW